MKTVTLAELDSFDAEERPKALREAAARAV